MKNKYLYLIEEYEKEVKYPLKTFENNDGCVYLIYNPLNHLCKIGTTVNFRQRLRQLISQSGVELQPIIVLYLQNDYDEPAYVIEKFLHDFYKEKRKIGEWFQFDIKDYIQIRNLFFKIEGEDILDYFEEDRFNRKYARGTLHNHHVLES